MVVSDGVCVLHVGCMCVYAGRLDVGVAVGELGGLCVDEVCVGMFARSVHAIVRSEARCDAADSVDGDTGIVLACLCYFCRAWMGQKL